MSFINPESEKRRFSRVSLDTPISYKIKNSNEFGSTLTRDISEGGLRLALDRFLPVNTDLSLEISLDRLPSLINAVAKVVWIQKLAHAERYQFGLEFQEIEDQQRKNIIEYVKSRRF